MKDNDLLLLTSKPIERCESQEEEGTHYDEIVECMEHLCRRYENHTMLFQIKYIDEGHLNAKSHVEIGEICEWSDMVERCDFKNGMDLYKMPNADKWIIRVYGQSYTMKSEDYKIHHMIVQDVIITEYEYDE